MTVPVHRSSAARTGDPLATILRGGTLFPRRGSPRVQKVSEVVGTSKESFAQVAETTAKSVRNLKRFRAELEGRIEGRKVAG